MKKGLIIVFIANLISLAINILNSFLLPKFLSIDTYAMLKTYTFYVGYAGFLSLGFADGMYLKYGGEDFQLVSNDELSKSVRSYFVLELIASLILIIIAIFSKYYILVYCALGAFFINIIGYYKNFYQAVGEFKLYGKSLNYQTALLFIVNLFLIFLIKTDNSYIYISVQVITACIVAIYLTIFLNKRKPIFHKGSLEIKDIKRIIVENVGSGFSLMLGNFSSSIFTGLDRWFVKILLDNVSFAFYSFAVSLENILNVFITPITVSLYNVFCKNREREYVIEIKKMTLAWGFIILSLAFPVKFIIQNYLTNYTHSLSIIFPLFGAQAFYVVIKGIHVNLYKAEQKQKRYFAIMLAMIVIATILNGIFYCFNKNAETFAYATFLTAGCWFVYCEIESSSLRLSLKEYLAILVVMFSYFGFGQLDNCFIGIALYAVVVLMVLFALMNATLRRIVGIVKESFNKILIK